MGVAVLHPHDSLTCKPPNRYRTIAPHFSDKKLSNPNPSPKSHRSTRSRKKRTDPTSPEVPGPAQPTIPQKHLLMGQVKILKRGELLTETTQHPQLQTEAAKELSTQTGAVEREVTTATETKKINPTSSLAEKVEGFYAGYSILVMSPPPSSVPLPAFITKKIAAVNGATRDLRKMMRPDFV
ncbi:unnamed protein product [Sphenostylis stenocarpa]|uniref:Uncharacterized protein n=1 Tax=Sphenostylis stenocarpa TaxID=92480 RepID=A0AA86SZ72_9FABA|nr:unnamed protein product [Sphenostylis stenocarpa]